MIGDCTSCGHSIAYHLPLLGCTKCDCDEFHVKPMTPAEFIETLETLFFARRISKEQFWIWFEAYYAEDPL